MTTTSFEDRMIKQYHNRILTDREIELICRQAVDEGLLQKEEVKDVSNCTTVELLNYFKKWKSAYLYDALKLDGSSDTEYETIREEGNKLYDTTNVSCFYTPNTKGDKSFLTQIYQSPINTKVVAKSEPEDPFSSPYGKLINKGKEFESFCEDLKEKTKSIKRQSNERTVEAVEKLVDGFIEYTERRKGVVRKRGSRMYAVAIVLILALVFLYTPKPI